MDEQELSRRIAANREEAIRRRLARLQQQNIQQPLSIRPTGLTLNSSVIHSAIPTGNIRPLALPRHQGLNGGRSSSAPLSYVSATPSTPRFTSSDSVNAQRRGPSNGNGGLPVAGHSGAVFRPGNAPDTSRQPLPPKPVAPIQKYEAQAVLISRLRFEIRSQYCKQLVDLCKRFRTKAYNPDTRRWSFELSDYLALERAIRVELCDFVVLEGLPKCVLDAWRNGSFSDSRAEITDLTERIPPNLLDALLPYQRDGVRFAVRNNGRILLADDMGLGKTVQSISIAVYFRSSWPVLCVCPSSMRFEWKEQWKRWVPELKDGDVSVITNGRQTDSLINVKIAVITYDLLSTMKQYLVNRFPTIILDECHHLKNYKASRTMAASDVCRGAQRLILLSGTPALSKPSELYPQIEIINKSLFKNFQEFGKRYCAGHITSRGYPDYSGQSNPEELQILLESTIMIRRMKQDVAQQLPDKTRIVIILDKNLVQYEDRTLSLSASSYMEQASSSTATSQEIRRCLLNFYQHTGRAKLPAVIKYMEDAFAENDSLKVVIFAHHCTVLDGIYEALGGGTVGIRIDGSTPPETRKELVDRFQTNDDCRFAVLSITACSSGITMTAASLVVFAELYWNPGILAQAEDRLHRLGQKNNVTVKYLVAKETSDDHMWTMLQRKLKFLNQVGLSRDDLNNASMENQESVAHRLELAMEVENVEAIAAGTDSGNPDDVPSDDMIDNDLFDQMVADDLNESIGNWRGSPSKRIKLSD